MLYLFNDFLNLFIYFYFIACHVNSMESVQNITCGKTDFVKRSMLLKQYDSHLVQQDT